MVTHSIGRNGLHTPFHHDSSIEKLAQHLREEGFAHFGLEEHHSVWGD